MKVVKSVFACLALEKDCRFTEMHITTANLNASEFRWGGGDFMRHVETG